MANGSSLPVLPQKPVAHTYVLTANKSSNSSAYYTFTDNGATIPGGSGNGGWDDTTPWASPQGGYQALLFSYDGYPAFKVNNNGSLAGSDYGRTAVYVHQDFGSPTSQYSQGCLVVDPNVLQAIQTDISKNNATITTYNQNVAVYNAQLSAYNSANGTSIPLATQIQIPKSTISVVSPDTGAPTITLTANKSSFGSTNYVQLTLGLTKPLSKDIWVFITVNNPDGWNINAKNIKQDVLVLDSSGKLMSNIPVSQGAGEADLGNGGLADGSTYAALQAAIRSDGKDDGSIVNGGDMNQNGFWVRIPAGKTSEEVDVAPDFKVDTGSSRTETFTIGDYGIVYANSGDLYRDGSGTPTHVLLGYQSQGPSINVTITDQSYKVALNGDTFYLGQSQNNSHMVH